ASGDVHAKPIGKQIDSAIFHSQTTARLRTVAWVMRGLRLRRDGKFFEPWNIYRANRNSQSLCGRGGTYGIQSPQNTPISFPSRGTVVLRKCVPSGWRPCRI